MANQLINGLSLLALKVKQNVFDLSSGQYNISIRDQIARGGLFARDLLQAHPETKSILIVGAGIAAFAAAERALRESEKVHVYIIDREKEPFSVQRGIKNRYVGPFMYEWPASMHADQHYPPQSIHAWGEKWPTTLTWPHTHPVSADDLCKDLDAWANHLVSENPTRLTTWYGVDGGRTIAAVKDFVVETDRAQRAAQKKGKDVQTVPFNIHFVNGAPHRSVDVNYLVLGCGPGRERVELIDDVKGAPFWSDDTLLDSFTAKQQVGIFGGGDGALQDVLRALTGHPHPLSIIDHLRSDKKVRRRLQRVSGTLLTAESQARLLQNWTNDVSIDARLDRACRNVATALAHMSCVRTKLIDCMRKLDPVAPGAVHHVIKGDGFDRAYMLNRFLVHLVHQSQKYEDWQSAGCVPYRRHEYSRAVKATKVGGSYTVDLSDSNTPPTITTLNFDVVAVRYGIRSGTTPSSGKVVDEKGDTYTGQLIQLSKKKSNQRISLGKIQLPFLVP